MPVDGEDGQTTDRVSVLGTPEGADQLLILLVVEDVHLAGLVVFELGVVVGLLGNASAAPEPNTHDLLLLLGAEHEMSSKAPLSEVVESLEETLKKILSLVHNFTFTFILFVV